MSPIASNPRNDLIVSLRAGPLKLRPQLLTRHPVNAIRGSVANKGDSRIIRWKQPFSVLSFNCLAQGLSNTDEAPFEFTEPIQDWKARRAMILEEILRQDPDIIGLQEVDDYAYLDKHLSRLGYSGTFLPKPSSACLDQPNNIGPDGCAVFFRTLRFRPLLRTTKHATGGRVLRDAHGLDTNAVVAWAILEDVQTNDRVAFFTTHFKARKAFGGLRAEQATDLVRCIKTVVAGKDVDHVICAGDFNAIPEEKAIGIMLSHGFRSAYFEALGGRNVDYTTWKKRKNMEEKKTCIDHIFYKPLSQNLRVEQYLDVPEAEQMGKELLPCMAYPSDHISLWASFSAM